MQLTIRYWQRLVPVSLIALILAVLVGARPATSVGDSSPQPGPQSNDSLEVRFAQANLELAKLEVQRVVEKNQQVPHSFPQVLVERLQDNVRLAELQLKQLTSPDDASRHAVHIAEAKLAVERAQRHLERGVKLNRRMERLADATELARRQWALRVAELRLERARKLDLQESPHAHMEWQLEQLRDELLDLRLELAKLKHV